VKSSVEKNDQCVEAPAGKIRLRAVRVRKKKCVSTTPGTGNGGVKSSKGLLERGTGGKFRSGGKKKKVERRGKRKCLTMGGWC